jgi:hypothetical protein
VRIERVERAQVPLRLRGSVPLEVRGHRRQEDAQRVDLPQQLEAAPRRARAQQLHHFLEHARRRAAGNLLDVLLHRRKRRRLDVEGALGREADGPQDAHRILAHPHVGVADGPHQRRGQICLAADVVDHPPLVDVVEERVDGEVAPPRILLLGAEDVVVADEQVVREVLQFVERVGAEGGDLDDLPAAEEDVREPEAPPDQPRVAEDLLHLVRVRAGRDVEVLRADTEQEVADAAAHEVRLVTGAPQPADDLDGVGVEELLGDLGGRLGRCFAVRLDGQAAGY